MKTHQRDELLKILKDRFEKNMSRHERLEWAPIQARLEANADRLRSLNEMEQTGGEPDVVGYDKETDEYIYYDCSAESPTGRRSVCYDREGLESRKEHKPKDSAVEYGGFHGHRASDRSAISGVAETRSLRHKNLELGENAC
jgi:hypothetical protein